MRDNIESNYLIFISSDGKREGYEIFKERIKNNMRPIYNKTPQLINIKKLPKIDLLIGGSPCQDLSNAHKGEGIDGVRSSLFYQFIKFKNRLKPKYFLLENVKNKWSKLMNKEIGVEGIELNSMYLSGQYRPRVYWTNIDFNEINFDKKNKTIKD